MESLFKFTLKPGLSGSTSWEVLKDAFEGYERSDAPRHIHGDVRLHIDQCSERFDLDGISNKVEQLIYQYQLGV